MSSGMSFGNKITHIMGNNGVFMFLKLYIILNFKIRYKILTYKLNLKNFLMATCLELILRKRFLNFNECCEDGHSPSIFVCIGKPLDRNAQTNPAKLWPNGILYYVIDQSLARYTTLIHGAMAEYATKTGGCITFRPGTGQGNYLYIGKYEGCNSWVGMSGGRQRVSFGEGCQYHGIVLHELGHAIGMYHEQNRSDRDKYVRILTQNIKKVFRFAFKKVGQDKNYLFTKYDYGSIMQYGKKSFSINGLDTIEPIYQTSVFGQRKALSTERAAKPMVPAKTSKPLMHCGFELGFCVFKNVVPHALFVRNKIKDYYYLQAYTPGLDHRIESIPMRYYGTGTICITIQYFSRGYKPICEFGIITGAQHVTRIKLAATSKWLSYSRTVMGLKPNYQFRVSKFSKDPKTWSENKAFFWTAGFSIIKYPTSSKQLCPFDDPISKNLHRPIVFPSHILFSKDLSNVRRIPECFPYKGCRMDILKED
ncbi:Zinc metalloproteinase nas-15 [Nymphon striatum]|nr:Zinc metalloproteinase nas-15 [Nymphon striatum]